MDPNQKGADGTFLRLLQRLNKTNDINEEEISKYIKTDKIVPKNSKTPMRVLTKYWMTNILKVGNSIPIFKELNKLYHKLYENPSTLDNYFTQDIRKPISQRFGSDSKIYKDALKYVALPYDVKGKILKDAQAKVIAKNTDTEEVDPKLIIAMIQENIVSDDPYRKAVALLLASGSRPIELFSRSEYKAIDEHWVEQDNIAKKKGEAFSVKKPIIYLSAERFVEELEEVRSELKKKYKSFETSQGQLNPTISNRANIIARQVFEGAPGFTLYSARKLYGSLSYDLFAKNKKTIHGNNPNRQVWFSKVLGHKEGSISVSFNYSNFSLKPDETLPDELARKQAEIDVKLEHIEDRLDDLKVPEIKPEPLKKIPDTKPERSQTFRKIIEAEFDKYVKENKRNPSQAYLEKTLKKKMPRAYIREYFRSKISSKTD